MAGVQNTRVEKYWEMDLSEGRLELRGAADAEV